MKIDQPVNNSRNSSTYLSIVVPIYNEQETLAELCLRITKVMKELSKPYELIFVNDGSSDRSVEILRELHAKDSHVKFVSLSRNFGHQIAISAGVDFASGQAVIIMDGDLQDPPEVIPLLVAEWQGGNDVVYAVRKERHGEKLFKMLAYKLFYRINKKLTNIEIPLDAGDFRIMSRRVINSLKLMPERNRFVRGLTSWVGFKQTGIEYVRQARFAGKTKYSWNKLLRLAFDGITSFSFVPLQIATYIGFFVSALCLIYALYVMVAKLFMNVQPQGWPSLMVAVMFLGGVQLITLGIIGEYLGRIFDEVKQRPLYITDEMCGFSEKE